MNLPQTSMRISSQEQQLCSRPALVSQSNSQASVEEGRWNDQDSLRFVVFVHKYQQIFQSKHQRKSCKIFKHFSEYLTKRTPSQCRSHFQKLMLKHKTVAKLKREYRGKFGDAVYHHEMRKLEEHLAISGKGINGESKAKKTQIGVQTEGELENHSLGHHSVNYSFPFFQAINGLALLPFRCPTWTPLNRPLL